MPSVTFDKEALLRAVKRKLSDAVLAEKIAMLGTDVQEISETSVSVEIFPNRPDLLSLQGFARALRAFVGSQPGLQQYTVNPGKLVVDVKPSVKTVRPFTACAVVRRLRLDDEKLRSIIDIQEKLHISYGRKRKRIAMGIYPLDAINGPISYEARSPSDIVFTPLDMAKPLPALQILKDHPKGKEFAHLLYGLREFPCFVDSQGAVLSLVPIINSAITGRVTAQTRDVFIEVSGHNFIVCHKALLIVTSALADMGGVLESVEVRYGAQRIRTPSFTPEKMKLTPAAVNELLGTSLTQKEIGEALGRMGYDVTGTTVTIPPYRTDILHEVDLIEDVAIGYGYGLLKPTMPAIATIGNESREALLERTMRTIMVGMGFIEAKNFCLSSPRTQLEHTMQIRRLVEIENPLTTDYAVLRHQLLPGLFETLAKNLHHEYPQLIFEIGPIWNPDEEPHLSFVICAERGAGFTEAKQVVETLFRHLGKTVPLKPYEEKLFISGRAAVFPGGFFGEVHPKVLENFGIPFGVAAGEIRFKELFE